MATSLPSTKTHENDVIFNMDSLREFIRLIKSQGTENIDFYAVSELLQPPGSNVLISVPEGTKDVNLEPWKELYNNNQRSAKEDKLQEFDNITIGENYIQFNIDITMYQYLPPIRERDYNGSDGPNQGEVVSFPRNETYTHFYSGTTENGLVYDGTDEGLWGPITASYPLQEEYITISRWDSNADKMVQDTTSTSFVAKENLILTLNFESKSKIDPSNNNESISMNYYTNLFNLVNLIKNNKFTLDKIDYYTSVPVIDKKSDKQKLYYVLNTSVIQRILNALNNYYNYNEQINKYAVENNVPIYIKKPISETDGYDSSKPWWRYIYVKYNGSVIADINENNNITYNTEFNATELSNNPGKIVVVRKSHPWQQGWMDDEVNKWNININSGRHLFVQAGSLLKFNPCQSTEEKDLIDDYWTDTTPGTFSIDENDGQKAHIITIRGFDQNGDFNNKNPIIGYINQDDIPENQNNDGIYKINDENYNLTPEQLANLASEFDILPVYNLENEIVGYIKKTDVPQESNSDGEYKIDGNKYNLKPVYDLNNKLIGYIDYNDIPQDTNSNGNYKIGENTYDLDSNQIIQLFFPVYLNNNDANIITHELTVDKLNLAGNNNTGDKTKFLRNDSQWANQLYGSLTLGEGNNNQNGRLVIYGTNAGDISANGSPGNVSLHTTGAIKADLSIWASKVYKAVFNDYAEYRQTIDLTPGHIVIDNDDGSLSCTTKRLQPGAQVISDTFGDAMGWTEKCQTPIAVAGRVLVYTYQSRENYHAGMAVCSAPNGTVDIMTREEIREYPDCIIGIVSEIPNYEKWGTDQVDVNGRIWIKIK